MPALILQDRSQSVTVLHRHAIAHYGGSVLSPEALVLIPDGSLIRFAFIPRYILTHR